MARYVKAAGVPVMLNPAPAAELPEALLRCVTYLSPNEHEAAALAGLPLRADENGVNEADMKAVFAALWKKGVENVIITLGETGSAVAGAVGVSYTPSVTIPDVKDPTAAGDSFVAAFCTAVTAGLTETQALAFASHTAALTVSRWEPCRPCPPWRRCSLCCGRGSTPDSIRRSWAPSDKTVRLRGCARCKERK